MKVKLEVPVERISHLLCSALEGGSNYWYTINTFHMPKSLAFRTDKKKVFKHIDWPLNKGGWLTISSTEEPERPTVRFNLKAAERGLQLMAEKYPQHFADFIKEDDDQTTGDVFLQLSVYGEVLYG